MQNMSSISIIGAGWLGLPLASHLRQLGHKLVLSRREIARVEQLTTEKWTAFSFQLGECLPDELSQSSIAVINIPPGRKSFDPETFFANIRKLCIDLQRNNTKNIIFISTTSVYGDKQGLVNELTECYPVTNSGKIHLEIERFIHALMPKQATVLRLAGLVGDTRHPAKSLSGKQQIPNPNQAVNLIHRDDVITAIQAIIDKQLWGHTLHLAATSHPKRKEYYCWSTTQLGLPPPEFVN